MSLNDGMFSSATDQHNTPNWLVEKIAAFLGGIELDPCTSVGNPVGAERFYTEAENGLNKKWDGRSVYMNPPYGRDIGLWTIKLANHYRLGHITQAITLLPARTDTQWWNGLAAYPVCLLRGRLKFNDCGQSAPFPSALIYLGNNWHGFAMAFRDIGTIYVPMFNGTAESDKANT